MRDIVHIVLVSGGREHGNAALVWRALDAVLFYWGDVLIVHGACPTGVDLYAEMWAKKRQQMYWGIPAEWDKYGKRAGMKRNAELIAYGQPHQAVIFEGNRGTLNMLSICKDWHATGDLKYLWLPEGEFWK